MPSHRGWIYHVENRGSRFDQFLDSDHCVLLLTGSDKFRANGKKSPFASRRVALVLLVERRIVARVQEGTKSHREARWYEEEMRR